MVPESQEWVLRRSVSSWKRVRYAGGILGVFLVLFLLTSRTELRWLAFHVFAPLFMASGLFCMASLVATAAYKMSGGFLRNDRFLGERFSLLPFVIRDEIPGGREASPRDGR